MTVLFRFSIIGLFLFSLMSCGTDVPNGTSGLTPDEIAAQNEIDIENFLSANPSLNEMRSSSGLVYAITEEGNGTFPTLQDTVTIDFQVTLSDGTIFSDTRATGNPLSLPMSAFVTGLQEGLQKLSVGGRGIFLLPAILGLEDLPPGISDDDLLIYDITLNDINFEFAGEAERLAIETYLTANNLVPDFVTETGLNMIFLEEGTGESQSPTISSTVIVDYHGTLLDGTIFDTTRDRGFSAEFPLANLIPGWQEGIALMSRGDRVIMVLPSAIAYGNFSPTPIIPPNAVLVFEVTLVDFVN